ncbi:MAG: right-handed parallel beta-helix repeat-containing protein, partial [Methanobrevibacter sp.]|nr:right-handed parallel beta-helix repeat-containing protein [Methanobrevibacter sp.]
MFKKINILLILLLLFISVTAVSAVDDGDMNLTSDENDLYTIGVQDISLSEEKVDIDSDILSESSVTINNGNYGNYFGDDGVYKGDASEITLSGSISSKNFIFNKTVVVSGDNSNNLENSVLTFLSGASGSSISNLKITNNVNEKYGIFLNSASNCVIKGCTIVTEGKSSYPICLGNDANHNNVTDNVLTTSGAFYGHGTRSTPTLLVSGSHYNYIANNEFHVDDANAIYLSSYVGGPLKGGNSNFNVIYNNSVKYNVIPTSWTWSIQVMGDNNTILSNTIDGAYRGISTGDNSGNKIIGNRIINIVGRDYNNLNLKTGGDFGIEVSKNSYVANNYIINASIIGSGAGIRVSDNCIVENNYIEVISDGKGIVVRGENGIVENNTVIVTSGSGIYQNQCVPGLIVRKNNVTSTNASVCILIDKQNSKSMPYDITIVNNILKTDNEYAIDAKGADSSSNWIVDESNKIIGKGKILTPTGVFDPSKPTYNFNGTVYNIDESNYHSHINANGEFVDIEDNDVLNFTGDFYNKIIIVNKQVKITGNNANFYNSSFKITSAGVQIENLNIINKKANRANAWGIFVNKVEGVRIFNNNIEVNDPNAAYAIYVLGSTYAEIVGNNLTSSGDFLTFTLLVYESSDCILSNNQIKTIGTSVVYNLDNGVCIDGDTVCLDGETICIDGQEVCLDGQELTIDNRFSVAGAHVVSEIYRTYGILMISSSNTNVTGNRVLATSKLSKFEDNSTNSIVGIDAYFNSQNNTFSDNSVFIKSHDKYIYGMGVLGQDTMSGVPKNHGGNNNIFKNNQISLEGEYYTCGIIIGYGSE